MDNKDDQYQDTNMENSTLDFSASGIEDIAFIKKYKGLNRLNLDSNQIVDLSPISILKDLTHLSFMV